MKSFEAEGDFIGAFVAEYCRPHAEVVARRLAEFAAERQMGFFAAGCGGGVALAAGPCGGGGGGEPRAPDEAVTFTFASAGSPESPGAWRARLEVPAGAGPETMAELTVEGASGETCGEGTFRLSGMALPLSGGRAEIPFGRFLAGIKDTDVSYRAPGRAAVAGTLAFFC